MTEDGSGRSTPRARAVPRPALLVVDDDPHVLRAIRRDLRKQYNGRYRVLSATSAREALALTEQLAEQDEDVALFLSDQRMPDMSGVDFLLAAVKYFPEARRALLTAYADTDAAITAINEVRLDYYLTKPWDPPQSRLYPVLDDLLADWHAKNDQGWEEVQVIGHAVSPSTHRIREFLTRNERPFRFVDVELDDRAQQVVDQYGDGQLPLVVLPDGAVLVNPGNTDLAGQVGLSVAASRPHYDVVIVGAGPAGLGAAVYAASEGLTSLLLDSDTPGGQAGTSSRIENYLGFPSGVSGADLTRRAVTQARRFGAEILNPVEVVGLRRADPARIVTLSDGTEISAETVLLTMGVQYNRLDVPGADRFEGPGVYYGAAVTETPACVGQDVYIVGGANSAGQAAIHFARYAAKVTMLVRADSLEKGMSQYLVDEIAAIPNIHVRTSTQLLSMDGGSTLERITVVTADGTREELSAQLLFTFIGAQPRTDWLAGLVERDPANFVLTGPDLRRSRRHVGDGWSLPREPLLLETSIPGVFAAGDVRSRSVKRVASGVGEGALAIALVHRYRDGA